MNIDLEKNEMEKILDYRKELKLKLGRFVTYNEAIALWMSEQSKDKTDTKTYIYN